MNNYRFASLVGVVLLGLVLSSTARADSYTYDSIVFTGSVTNTTATLTIQCTDAKACGGFYLGDVTLKGFNYAGTPTLVSAPVGYDAVGHILRRHAGIKPDHRNHWDVDIGEDVRGSAKNCNRRQKNDDERHHHECVGTPES